MLFSIMFAAAGLLSVANSWASDWNSTEIATTVTLTTDLYITFCPLPTTFSMGTK